METRPLRTDEEIAKAIKENYGDYNSYRKSVFANYNRPIEAPKPIAKTAAEISASYYEAIAKARGISLAEFFKNNPDEYRRYSELATSRDY